MLSSGLRVFFEGRNMARLMAGLLVTLKIALISIAICFLAGLLAGLLMTSKRPAVRAAMRVYLESVRIVPVLVWLFLVFFGVTRAWGLNLSGELAAVLVFVFWGTAEMGDIVRGAIQSLPVHQRQSGMALGLTEAQIYRHVVAPQILRRLLPASINLATRMVKTTSLVVFVGVTEVVKTGQQIIEFSNSKNPAAAFWIYGLIFILYFLVCYPISLLSRRLEKVWAY
ncbi:MAG: amino acid ABC transporter permease [Clostridiales Family XIII bacterium]|jgi:polar amino acid transport system permease protein|nr:amino acid ABC transporter permease [Clostridiales Family XIII bacterium]